MELPTAVQQSCRHASTCHHLGANFGQEGLSQLICLVILLECLGITDVYIQESFHVWKLRLTMLRQCEPTAIAATALQNNENKYGRKNYQYFNQEGKEA